MVTIKRVVPFLGVCFFALGGASQARVTIEKAGGKVLHRFEVDAVVFKPVEVRGESFIEARLRGVEGYAGLDFEVGAPEVPVIRFFVDGDGAISVRAIPPATDTEHRLFDPLKPVLDSVPKVPGAEARLFLSHRYWADEEGVGPKQSFLIEEVGSVRGVRRRQVTLYPLRYHPGRGSLGAPFAFEVETDVAGNETPRAAHRETVAFIVGKAFDGSPSLARLIGLKRRLGYLPRILVIGKDVSTPAEIRSTLQALFRDKSRPLVAAVLVGGEGEVPSYPSKLLSGVTDHYYRAIDTDNYDTDIGTPDIDVGRFVVHTEAELATVVEKQVRYETGVFANDGWLNRFSFIATDDKSHWRIAEGSLDYLIDTYSAPKGFKGSYPGVDQAGGDKLYAITHAVTDATVVARMREGRGFINYGGHGGVTDWAGPRVTKADVLSLADPNALPLVISNACITGRFIEASFGETWQNHAHGSIVFWGSMDSTYWDEDDILQRRMYDAMFRDRKWEFARFTEVGLQEVWRYYGGKGKSAYYFETYVTFGDPLTRIRTRAPREVKLEGAFTKVVGDSSLVFRVLDQAGSPVSGARVAAVAKDFDYALSGTTDEQGRVSLTVQEGHLTPGRFELSVSGENLKLWQGALEYKR